MLRRSTRTLLFRSLTISGVVATSWSMHTAKASMLCVGEFAIHSGGGSIRNVDHRMTTSMSSQSLVLPRIPPSTFRWEVRRWKLNVLLRTDRVQVTQLEALPSLSQRSIRPCLLEPLRQSAQHRSLFPCKLPANVVWRTKFESVAPFHDIA